jgi:hypothetical protein
MPHVGIVLAEVAAAACRRGRRHAARTAGGTGTYQIAHSRASPRWSHHIAHRRSNCKSLEATAVQCTARTLTTAAQQRCTYYDYDSSSRGTP